MVPSLFLASPDASDQLGVAGIHHDQSSVGLTYESQSRSHVCPLGEIQLNHLFLRFKLNRIP